MSLTLRATTGMRMVPGPQLAPALPAQSTRNTVSSEDSCTGSSARSKGSDEKDERCEDARWTDCDSSVG